MSGHGKTHLRYLAQIPHFDHIGFDLRNTSSSRLRNSLDDEGFPDTQLDAHVIGTKLENSGSRQSIFLNKFDKILARLIHRYTTRKRSPPSFPGFLATFNRKLVRSDEISRRFVVLSISSKQSVNAEYGTLKIEFVVSQWIEMIRCATYGSPFFQSDFPLRLALNVDPRVAALKGHASVNTSVSHKYCTHSFEAAAFEVFSSSSSSTSSSS